MGGGWGFGGVVNGGMMGIGGFQMVGILWVVVNG